MTLLKEDVVRHLNQIMMPFILNVLPRLLELIADVRASRCRGYYTLLLVEVRTLIDLLLPVVPGLLNNLDATLGTAFHL